MSWFCVSAVSERTTLFLTLNLSQPRNVCDLCHPRPPPDAACVLALVLGADLLFRHGPHSLQNEAELCGPLADAVSLKTG